MINGRYYDWESVTIIGPSGEYIGISDINYSDEKGAEPRYGKGSTPYGYGNKNYKASGNMTLAIDEAERLRKSLGGSFYNGTFNTVVNYEVPGKDIVTDTLRDCKITKVDTSAQQDDDNTGARKLDFNIFSPIEWNGVPAV
jgi:hypothetical protein